MPTHPAFLAAIAAQPEDDLPRMVYADWIEEQGDSDRAEFIRIQCERDRLPSWDRRSLLLRLRERTLLLRNSEVWRAELPDIPGVTWGPFRRGFVSEVTVQNLDTLLERAEELRTFTPLDSVTIPSATTQQNVGRTIEFPWLRRFHIQTRYSGDGGEIQLERMLASGLATHLKILDLSGCGVENPGAQVIAAAHHLTALDELNLSECYVGVAGAEALAQAKHLGKLRVLRFSNNGSGYVEDPFVTTDGVQALADSPYLRNLSTLDLTGNPVSNETWQLLVTAKNFATLQTVSLGYNDLTEAGFAAAAGPARWKELNFRYGQFGDAGVVAMVKLPQLSELAKLSLDTCNVSELGATALVQSPLCSELRVLDLSTNRLNAESAYQLARVEWPQLHTLNLSGNALGAEGVKHLAESGRFPHLTSLNLESVGAEDAGVRALAQAGWAGQLRSLALDRNQLTERSVQTLASSARLHGLIGLDLSQNPLDSSGFRSLKAGTWEQLTDLNLANTKIGDDCVRELERAGVLSQLIDLQLIGCDLTEDAITRLAKTCGPQLRSLQLGDNPRLGANGIAPLCAPGVLPGLWSLWISGCKLPAKAIEQLAQSPLLSHLRRMVWYGNETSRELEARLRPLYSHSIGPDWSEFDYGRFNEYEE